MTTRNQSLDALRSIALLLVIGYHFRYFPVVSKIGWCGVDLFFVLSGFLISGLLFDEYRQTGTIRIGRFWLRRGFKIWPSLYIFLLVMFPLALYWQNGRSSLVASGLFYANYTPVIPLLGHTWSLAVEEHFYLALPLLLYLLIGVRRVSMIPWIGAGLLVVCAVLRVLSPSSAEAATQCRVDSLFVGVVLAYWRRFSPDLFEFASVAIVPAVLAIVLAFTLPPSTFAVAGYPMLAIGFGGVLAFAIDRQPLSRAGNFVYRKLAGLGVYSYSIYLWQQPFTGVYGRHPTFAWLVVVLGIMLSFAVGMSKLIEWPMLAMRDRIFPATDWRS